MMQVSHSTNICPVQKAVQSDQGAEFTEGQVFKNITKNNYKLNKAIWYGALSWTNSKTIKAVPTRFKWGKNREKFSLNIQNVEHYMPFHQLAHRSCHHLIHARLHLELWHNLVLHFCSHPHY